MIKETMQRWPTFILLWLGFLTWYSFGQSPHLHELPRPLQKLIETRALVNAEADSEHPVTYEITKINLNPQHQTFLVAYQSVICGTGGCPADIFIRRGNRWQLFMEAWNTLRVLDHVQHGWHDFAIYGHSSWCCGDLTIYRWNPQRRSYAVYKRDEYINGTTLSELAKKADALIRDLASGKSPVITEEMIEDLKTAVWQFLPPKNEKVLEALASVMKYQRRYEKLIELATEGMQFYPEKPIWSKLLSEAHLSLGRYLSARLWLNRSLRYPLSDSEKKEIMKRLETIAARAAIEEKEVLQRPVLFKAAAVQEVPFHFDLPYMYELLLQKANASDSEPPYQLLLVFAEEILDRAPFPLGYLDERARSLFEKPSQIHVKVYPFSSAYHFAAFTFSWQTTEPVLEQQRLTRFVALDLERRQLRPVREDGIGFIYETFRAAPFLLRRARWEILEPGPAKNSPPPIKMAQCTFEGNPHQLKEAGAAEYHYAPETNMYSYKTGTGRLTECPLGDQSTVPLWRAEAFNPRAPSR